MKKETKMEESIQKFELTSDLFFSIVLEDVEVCQEVVRILTGRDLCVLEVKCQYTILSLSNHSIRLDILAKEMDGRMISLEMHPQANEDRVKRTRFNVGSIDVQTLRRGEEYRDLPDVIHIYITKADFLKTKKGVNYIKRIVSGTDIEVPNGIEEYYISLSCKGENADQTALLQYMVDSHSVKTCNSFPKLVKRVNFLRKKQEGIEIMCEILDGLIADAIREKQLKLEETILAYEEISVALNKKKAEVESVKIKVEEAKVEVEEAKVEVEEAKAEAEEAKAEVEEAKAEVEEAKAEVEEAKAEVEEAKAEVEEAKAEVEEAKAEVEEAKAEVEEAKAEVEDEKNKVTGVVEILLELNISSEEIIEKLMNKFRINKIEAKKYLDKICNVDTCFL